MGLKTEILRDHLQIYQTLTETVFNVFFLKSFVNVSNQFQINSRLEIFVSTIFQSFRHLPYLFPLQLKQKFELSSKIKTCTGVMGFNRTTTTGHCTTGSLLMCSEVNQHLQLNSQ